MGQGRKYYLNMNSVISCGLGSYTGNTIQYSLLDSFTMTYDTIPVTTCTYPTLTTVQLQGLSNIEYDKRVIDFLDYLNVESSIQKEALFTGATISTSDCSDYFCLLNENFLVYKFLSGIRVVNVGEANGVVQYLVSGNSYNSGWQNNGTFLNLDLNEIYTVTIRDYIASENLVVCQYYKLISMPTLIPSTTVTLQSKLIGLREITSNSFGNISYKTGCIEISPNALSQGQKFTVDYTANATVIGEGSSFVQFTCKPNNCGTFDNYCCITNLDAPQPINGSITLCYGDVVCYNVTAIGNACGSCANANFCLTSVDGMCTIMPSIDITNCSSTAIMQKSPLDVTVGMERTTEVYKPNLGICNTAGIFNFTPAIPQGQCIDIQLSATTISESLNSVITYYCMPNGSANYICVCGVNSAQLQPQYPVITARYGDSLCYSTNISIGLNEIYASECMCINNLYSSIGVIPIKDSIANCESSSISRQLESIVVGVCRTSQTLTYAKGYINTSTVIDGNSSQYVDVCYEIYQEILNAGCGDTIIYRRPYGGSSYVQYCRLRTVYPTIDGYQTGIFRIGFGESLCYTNCMTSSDVNSCSVLNLISATSSPDFIPSICSTKHNDVIVSSMV